ncbi:MAG: uracil-DNA glycosylase [Candidatus Omnitrophica bacterium]|nr:uracil-DNA glycosylase [Candidatus Omnitrophota bacterium]
MATRDEFNATARLLKQRLEGLAVWGVRELPVPRPAASGSSPRDPELWRGMNRQVDSPAQALARLEQEVIACRRCPLYRTRTHHVLGEGHPRAKLMFVGEAPGREEDLQGRPFVGAAGRLLTKMIEAIGLTRQDVYICNILKDRPPNNRPPEPSEVEACLPFLERQLAIIQPAVICALGATPAKALLGAHVAITKVRGQVREYRGILLVPTFHPAYLLRNPPAKRFAWRDLKTVKALLSETSSP